MTLNRYRIGFYGFGKRARNIYLPLIRKFEEKYELTGFYRRNSDLGIIDSHSFQIKYHQDPKTLLDNADMIIISVPEAAQEECLSSISNFSGIVLLETPVSNPRTIELSKRMKVGVIEQWIHTPVEQVKSLIYDLGILERPRVVQNNFRSYDYHAIAQMRAYLKEKSPKNVSCFATSIQLPSHTGNSNDMLKDQIETFDMSTIQMSDGALIQHNFSYAHKTSPLRGMQSISCISSNGSILTGRLHDKSNDCEIFDIRVLKNQVAKTHNVIVEYEDSEVSSISINGIGITWSTPKIGLSDQEIAISKILENAEKGILYSTKDAFIDAMTMRAIKIAGHNSEIVRFQ